MTDRPTSARIISRRFDRRPRRAFTLIELLVVLAILGIASAIIVPAIGTRDDLRVSAASRELLSDLLYAQNRAIALQKTHYIEFNGNSYTLYARDAATSAPYVINNPVTNQPYTTTFGAAGPSSFQVVAIGSVNFGAGSTSLGYDDLGSSWAYDAVKDNATAMTQTGTIVLQTTGKQFPLTITIQPYTGEASAP
jgi:prepilin-type N-terminal cleavage/methylation domain-containing protein